MADGPSRMLASRYEVGELIGRGGMAEVHIGRDTRLGRTVAIKVLRSDLARDPTFLARFRREAQSAASLNHPAIVSVYDTGEDISTDLHGTETRVPFIVMEYVEGHTVRELLRDGAALPIDEAIEITAGVLSALEYSHRAGIVHRDIKPANVMLTPTGDVKVMDFGIARAMTDSSGAMTQTQAVVGTAQYLSPEQARGEVVDTRSDLYSTGCLLYELLTGRPPFVGDSAVSVAYQHVSEEPSPPSEIAPDVPEELDRIVMKALTKDKEQRYATAAEFRSDLEAAAGEGVVSAPPIGAKTAVLGAAAAGAATGAATQMINPTPAVVDLDEDAEEEPKRNKALVWILVSIGVLALIAIIWLLLTRDEGPSDEPTSQTPTAESVEVPRLDDSMTKDDVTAALDQVGLIPEFQESEASDTVEAGHFLRSDPESGEIIEVVDDTDREVQVWLSAGPDSIKVPDVSGMTQDEARSALSDAGFDPANFKVETENIAGRPEGEADRTEPAAREDAPPDAAITIYLATGLVELPDLRGEPTNDALDQLNDLELRSQLADPIPSNDYDVNTIAISDPGAGLVPYDTTVVLTVSSGPPEEPTTEEPTTEDPTTEDPTTTDEPTDGAGEEPPVSPDADS